MMRERAYYSILLLTGFHVMQGALAEGSRHTYAVAILEVIHSPSED